MQGRWRRHSGFLWTQRRRRHNSTAYTTTPAKTTGGIIGMACPNPDLYFDNLALQP